MTIYKVLFPASLVRGWCYVGILLFFFCVSLILRLSISRVGFFLLLWLETPNTCFGLVSWFALHMDVEMVAFFLFWSWIFVGV